MTTPKPSQITYSTDKDEKQSGIKREQPTNYNGRPISHKGPDVVKR